ncbi:uncharacterized protein LOC136073504 [Hydra vulgaris]|uniref:uncharacterized protein LOC136073504 n=1 Tax=Hydra vulgaris TaxID=6087 RepID=UPI0032EA4B8D
MSTISLPCQAPGCNVVIEGPSEAIAIALFNSHQLHHPPNSIDTHSAFSKHKAPKMDRPHIGQDISEEEWANFISRWTLFKRCTDIRQEEMTAQLFQCCEDDLGNQLLKENPMIINENDEAFLKAMKKLAVIPVATCVRRAELLQMRQGHNESIRSFYAKLKGKAATCNYTVQCHCHPQTTVDFTDVIIRDIVVAGLSDTDIRKDVLGWVSLDTASVTDIIAFIEGKEMARNALGCSSTTASVSTFRKQNKSNTQSSKGTNITAKCPDCSESYSLFTETSRGWNKKPHKLCLDCWKRLRSLQLSIQIKKIRSQMKTNVKRPCTGINHHIFTHDGWATAQLLVHPTIQLRVTTNKSDYVAFGIPFPPIIPKYIQVITDTGAQSCLWSRKGFVSAGFNANNLIPVKHSMSAANKTQFRIDGAILLRLEGRQSNGHKVECAVMVYISPDANGFYLSKEAMTQLGIISKDFPEIGSALHGATNSGPITIGTKTSSENNSSHVCNCPKRSLPAGAPTKLPFVCCPENNERMKAWLLERYSASLFNTCPHQILPDMEGPPISILIQENAKPVAAFTPATIPIHLQDQVEKDLIRDETLGVIEKVPLGEPTTWCHRMVITRKHDGGPRRTVDLSPLNKYCYRETHAMKSPFQLARSVPRNSWKTVTDAWNGYHSIPIRVEDRNLTTFITPFGRYRYIRAPQGFVSSGDGYNRRFDEILADFIGKQRCVDDTIHYDDDLVKHWWRTIEFFELVGKAGIILNPKNSNLLKE